MEILKHYVTSKFAERMLVEWITNIMIGGHMGFGFVIIIDGVSRFAPPSYDPLIEMSRGHVWLWGIWILISGILMMTPFKWINAAGLWLGMFWHFVWASLFAVAVVRDAGSASTPVVAYTCFALICAALLTARILDHGED